MMHGYTLYASAQESNALKFSNISDSLLSLEKNLKNKVLGLEQKRNELIRKKGLAAESQEVLQNNLDYYAAQQDYRGFTDHLEQAFPDYHRLKYAIEPVSMSAAQKMLQPGQTLIEYLIGDSSLFIFALTINSSRLIETKLDFPLGKWVEDLRTGINQYHGSAQKTDALYEAGIKKYAFAAEKLYQKLLAPIRPGLGKDLIIIADAELHALPFEVLLPELPKDLSNFTTYPFLLKSHRVSYAYSATSLSQSKTFAQTEPPTGNLLAFAPFGKDNGGSANALATRDKVFPSLPYSNQEVKQTDRIIGGKNAVFTGEHATKAHFFGLMPQYRILHLATHAQANNKNAALSALAFHADAESATPQLIYRRTLCTLCSGRARGLVRL
jgi:CHAT domain-containing protein